MIRLENIRKTFPGFTLGSLDLHVARGEFFVLIGPTGAGKSLVLESVIGMVAVDAGRILLDGRDVTGWPPERRGIGIVYQDQALFPHLSVAQNIAYGLRYAARNKDGQNGRVAALVERFGLQDLLPRDVTRLSGGEKQRVALARALAVDPAVLLLDEPISALDPNFREDIRQVLTDLHRDTGITILMVTHDFADTHCLAQRVAVIHQGRIAQTGSPAEVFQRPGSPFVAGFVGMRNLFPAEFHGARARVGDLTLRLARPAADGAHWVGIRPEDLRLPEAGDGTAAEAVNRFEAVVAGITPRGFACDVGLAAGGLRLTAVITQRQLVEARLAPGARVWLAIDPDRVHTL